MVLTRSAEKQIPSKGPAYWEEKKKRRIRRSQRLSSSSSSSSSSDSDSNQWSNFSVEKEAMDSDWSIASGVWYESVSAKTSDHDSEDGLSSETAPLERSRRNDTAPLNYSKDSTLEDSTSNDGDTAIERKSSVEKACHSVDKSSSIVTCTEERQFDSLLKKRLSQIFQSNDQLKKKSSIYTSSDSEMEKNCHNSNVGTTSAEDETYITNQSDSFHEETNKENSNDFKVELEPTPSGNNITTQSFKIRLTRSKYEVPAHAHETQSKGEKNDSDASTSCTNETVTTKEKNEKIVETHQDVEVLMQQIFGSSESESEKKLSSRRKLQFSDSDTGKAREKSCLKKKLRICKSMLDGSSDSDLESEDSKKENTRRTPAKRIQSSDSESDQENIRRRPTKRMKITDSKSEPENTRRRLTKRIKSSDSESEPQNTRPTPGKRLKSNLEKSNSSKRTGQCNRIESNSLSGKVHKCNICEKIFPYPHVLRRHHQSIHQDPSFECSKCDKKFTRKDHLKNHQRIEHEQNLFQCTYCEKKFNYRHSKEKHEKSEHRKSRLFKCSLSSCRKSFACKYDFQNHEKMHEKKEQKYTCDECSKTFIDKFFLRKHIQRHLQSEKYKDDSEEISSTDSE